MICRILRCHHPTELKWVHKNFFLHQFCNIFNVVGDCCVAIQMNLLRFAMTKGNPWKISLLNFLRWQEALINPVYKIKSKHFFHSLKDAATHLPQKPATSFYCGARLCRVVTQSKFNFKCVDEIPEIHALFLYFTKLTLVTTEGKIINLLFVFSGSLCKPWRLSLPFQSVPKNV